jgi:hypothetical protein
VALRFLIILELLDIDVFSKALVFRAESKLVFKWIVICKCDVSLCDGSYSNPAPKERELITVLH